MTDISTPDETISQFLSMWERHRKISSGSAYAMSNSELFIPRERDMDEEDYRAFMSRVVFYPAAHTTQLGILGLLFRKRAQINGPKKFEYLLDTITRSGLPIHILAKKAARELITFSWGALLTDVPVVERPKSMAEARKNGVRPFISFYQAESVLQVPETAEWNGKRRVVRMRLLDDPQTVRELLIRDGVYTVVIHRLIKNKWVADAPIVPLCNGKPLEEIPLTLITMSEEWEPGDAPLERISEMNSTHFVKEYDYAKTLFQAANQVQVIAGVEDVTKSYPVHPGAQWLFSDPNVETKVLAGDISAIDSHRDGKIDLEAKMALVGSRMLENPKAVGESSETLLIRRAADNANTAMIANTLDAAINDQLKWVAYWLGQKEGIFRYSTNTDFNSIPLDAAERAQIISEWMAGFISKETAIKMFIDHGNLPQDFDWEADEEKIRQALGDLPPSDALPLEAISKQDDQPDA